MNRPSVSSAPSPSLFSGVPEAAFAVLCFSLTVPTMGVAVRELDPVLVGVGRMGLAAIPAAIYLFVVGSPRLTLRQVGLLAVVSTLLTLFAWLSALALRDVSSHHAAIVLGGAPLANALWGTLRGGRSHGQPWFFWVAAATGSLLVVLYGVGKGFAPSWPDLLLLIAALVSGIGYAEGTRLGREIGTTVLACWGPIAALPLALALCAGRLPAHPLEVSAAAWGALLYNALFSAFVGMVFWYRGLAKGGIARIAQIQLAQPFVTLVFSILLLGERPGWGDWLTAAGVVGCIALAQLGARRGSRTGAPRLADAVPAS